MISPQDRIKELERQVTNLQRTLLAERKAPKESGKK